MARIKLTGYTDHISVTEGDTVQFMVSAEGATRVSAEIVRLIHGDEHPEGPGFIEEVIPSTVSGSHATVDSSSTSAPVSTSTMRPACSTSPARSPSTRSSSRRRR